MIQQSTVNACVKAYYGNNEDTDYGKIQAVLRTYDAMRETNTAATGAGESTGESK